MKRLRVAMDARELASPVLRGMGRYVVGLTSALAMRGVHVTLLHPEGRPPHASHLAGVDCEKQAVAGREGIFWEQVLLPLALLRGRYDVYHAPAERGVPFVSPCPVVWTCHSVTGHSYHDLVTTGRLSGRVSDYLGVDFDPKSKSWRAIYWEMQALRATQVLTVSEFSRSEIIRFLRLPASRVTVTPLAVDKQFLTARRSPADIDAALNRLGVKQPYILYVGGFEPHKNVAGLIEVFSRIYAKLPELSLVAVGSKSVPASLRAVAAQHGDDLLGRVRFLENISDDMVDLYDAASLYVSLSWRESFGLPVLEAMTRGLEVVVSRWGAAPEIAGDVGELVDPRDCEAAATAVWRRLHVTAATARAQAVAATFSWDATAELTLRTYRRCTST